MNTSFSAIALIICISAISGLAVSEITNKKINLNFKALSVNLRHAQTTNKQVNDLFPFRRDNKKSTLIN